MEALSSLARSGGRGSVFSTIRLPGPTSSPFEKPNFQHRSGEHTSELQSLMRISYAVFCLKKKNTQSIKYRSSQNITRPTTYHSTTKYKTYTLVIPHKHQ